MVEIPDSLKCLFTGRITVEDGRYIVEIPRSAVEEGALEDGGVYRVGIIESGEQGEEEEQEEEAVRRQGRSSTSSGESTANSVTERSPEGPDRDPAADGPPVFEGEQRVVTIEAIGEEGDGIARVDRGYVLMVPDTKPGEEVRVEVRKVTPNVGFAEVIER